MLTHKAQSPPSQCEPAYQNPERLKVKYVTLTATRCCSQASASQDKTHEEEKTTPHTPGAHGSGNWNQTIDWITYWWLYRLFLTIFSEPLSALICKTLKPDSIYLFGLYLIILQQFCWSPASIYLSLITSHYPVKSEIPPPDPPTLSWAPVFLSLKASHHAPFVLI